MSERYPGGFISKNAPTVSTSGAQGVWTLEQQAAYAKAGQWPFGGPFNYIEDVFSTYLYTGTGSAQTITNGVDLLGKGGIVWIKNRSNGANDHVLFSTANGVNQGLSPNTTGALTNHGDSLTAFNSNGFTLGSTGSFGIGSNGFNNATWTFRKQPKFFDIVTYTGNGTANNTIPHALGSTVGAIFIKNITNGSNWIVWHRSNSNEILCLNLANANIGSYSGYVHDVTSTSFQVGTSGQPNPITTNASGDTYVAYLFAHNAGGFGNAGTDNVITCGSYTGTAAAGNFVNLGYEPQWIMVKNASSGSTDWSIFDTMRGIFTNGLDAQLAAQSSAEENGIWGALNWIDVNATGFTPDPLGAGYGDVNASGSTYIYIAIRRGPMKTPTTGTSVFSANKSAASAGTQITTNFVVDMQIQGYRPGDSENFAVADRLRGVSTTTTQTIKNLTTSSTVTETTVNGSQTRYWNNTGFQQSSYLAGADGIFWSFRRAPSFMDVVCYTGNGASSRSITHNLTVAPEMIIVKSRNLASTSWDVWHTANGVPSVMYLNSTSAKSTLSGHFDTLPTASVFYVGGSAFVNESGYTYVAYLFASCPGVSKVGSYTGTSSNQIINCGFPARFVMIKRTNGTSDWWVWDTTRGMVNGEDYRLPINTTSGEPNSNWVLTNANGFQLVDSNVAINTVDGTYIFLAIA